MKRYWYIVWRRQFSYYDINWRVIDHDPGEFILQELELFRNVTVKGSGPVVIINQFEISAEQYQALESLQ